MNVAPQLAQLKSDVANRGMGYGSYAGGLVGQQEAMGQLLKFQAGLENQQQQMNNTLAGRQSYFAGGPNIAASQNNADVNRGLGISQIQTNQAASQNQYGMDASRMQNSFNLDSYANAIRNADYQRQLNASRTQGMLGLGAGIGGLIGKGIGGLMGMGGGGGAAAGMSSSPFSTQPIQLGYALGGSRLF